MTDSQPTPPSTPGLTPGLTPGQPIEQPTDATTTPPVPVVLAEGNPEPPPSYVKLAMRNMVKKGGKSLFHFGLTTVGLLALLVGLAYMTH